MAKLSIPYPTDDELRAIDDELANEGVPIVQRPGAALTRWSNRHGIFNFLVVVDMSGWFDAKYAALHPSVKFGRQPLAYLCVSARGIAYEINPPIVYGTRRLNPIDSIKITQPELARIHSANPLAFDELSYQAADGCDLFMGHVDLEPQPEAAKMLSVGTAQLETSARRLVASTSDPSLPQAMCLACETIVKAVLHERGVSLQRLKDDLGHNLTKLCSELVKILPGPNDADLAAVAASMPNYVAMRYGPPSMNANQEHDIYRRAMFICAEALRRTRHDNIYHKMAADPTMPKRQW